jgi:NAD(P)-dependent dehydrogenase (short-subunit alcohol dehydrogenase family)
MRGKTVVITGGTSGIGEVAAVVLARMGARIVLVARDKIRGDATLARLRESAPGVAHTIHFADLLRLAEMKRVAAQIAASEPRIDVLINNAGALFAKRRTTEDGLERTFALNHMAYFVVTEGLRDRLLASSPARIINTASAAHQGSRLDFDDLQSAKSFGAMKAYGRSKLCNILFTRELARRLDGTGVTAIPVLSPHALAIKLAAGCRAPFRSPSFSQYLLPGAHKQLSISRPRRTWQRRPDDTFISPCQLSRRQRPRTTKLLYCSGSAARQWPA